MYIHDHKLGGHWYKPSPNNGGVFAAPPTQIVMHYTAGGSAKVAAEWLCNPESQVSAHVVVERDGTVLQIVPFNTVAWHATHANRHSIGIEIANWGSAAPGNVPPDRIVRAKHKNGGPEQGWEVYPEAQLAAVAELTRALIDKYPSIKSIVGHDDVDPTRKVDPGPAFPMDRFVALLEPGKGGTDAPAEPGKPDPVPAPKPQDRRAWVLEMIEAARPTAAKIGISPEAIVAQAALESGWGARAIGHNLFGIKAGPGWTGKTQTERTREVIGGQETYVNAAFRDYDSFAASIADHFAFLDGNSRYRDAGVFDGKGDDAYFEALQRAGYATDPNYATVLKSVLRSVRQLAGAAPVTESPVRKVLRAGDSGPDVAALKRALNAQNDAMLDQDDEYDTVTAAAVIHFQRARGLTVVDGVAGPETLGALGLA